MFSYILLHYRGLILKGLFIVSVVTGFQIYISNLKSTIEDSTATIVLKNAEIMELKRQIKLLKLNNIVEVTNTVVQSSSNTVFDSIKRLQELERRENDQNITIIDDDILDGMYLKGSY